MTKIFSIKVSNWENFPKISICPESQKSGPTYRNSGSFPDFQNSGPETPTKQDNSA